MPSSASCERHLEAGRRALSLGDLATAESELREAVVEAEHSEAGPEQLVAALSAQAQLLYQTRRFADAAPLFRRALDIREQLEGTDSPALVPAIHNVAAAYLAMGDSGGAEPLLRKALTVLEAAYGPEHAELAGVLNNLSQLYLKRGAHAEAEPLLRRLLGILRAQGEERPEVATVMATLASVQHALAEHDAAERLLRRVLEIRERTLAPNHFAVATTLEALAETCATRGKLDEALTLLERSLAMRERTLGGTHPSLAVVRAKMADLQLQLSQDAFAVPLMEPIAERRLEIAPEGPVADQMQIATRSQTVARPLTNLAQTHLVPRSPVIRTQESEHGSAPYDAIRRLAAELNQNGDAAVAERSTDSSLAISILPTGGALVLPGSDRAGQQENDDLLDDYQDEMRPARSSALNRPAVRVAIGAAALVVVAVSTTFALKGSADDDTAAAADYSTAGRLGQAPAGGSVALPAPAADSAGTTDGGRSESGDVEGERGASPANGSRETRTPPRSTAPARTASSARTEPEEPEFRLPSADRLLGGVSVPSSTEMPTVQIGGPESDTHSALTTLGSREGSVGTRAYSGRDFRPAAHIGPVPAPVYPASVAAERLRGEVVVTFTVDTNGLVDANSFRVERASDMRFVAPVTAVLPQMRFMPAELNGRRVEQTLLVPFRFEPGKREEDGGSLDNGGTAR